jgi:hypothetical protein
MTFVARDEVPSFQFEFLVVGEALGERLEHLQLNWRRLA